MSNFRRRACEVLNLGELQGFAMPEGQEEGTRGGAFVDTDLLIRAAMFLGSGGVRYRDAEHPATPAHYQKIEESWDAIVGGFKKAVQFYRNSGIPSGDWLPYRYLLLPPAIAAAAGHDLDERWMGWAIVASLWKHYAGEVDAKLQKDCTFAQKGNLDGLIDHVKTRAKRTESVIPSDEDFLRSIVAEGGVTLAMIAYFAKVGARSFPSGKVIGGAYERLEIQQIFPRRALDAYGGGRIPLCAQF